MATLDTHPTADQAPDPRTRAYLPGLRWWICGLLFVATTINYVDRNAISVLKTTLEQKLAWSEADYGWIAFAFTAAYAIFPVIAGRMIDALGVKAGFAIGVILWSLTCMAHGLVRTVLGFAVVRFLLGASEATNFPASIKAVAQWFPQRERALATGIFNSGPNVGVMISFSVVWLATTYGWPWAFFIVGGLGLIWLVFWAYGYGNPEDHPRLAPAERAYIMEGRTQAQQSEQVHWMRLLRYRQIWPFLLTKLLTDPVWWFFLYWLPSYLEKERGQNPLKSALLLVIIYSAATIGSVTGGWFSGRLMSRGWRVSSARYVTMLVPALFMPAAIGAYYTHSFALCLALISLATALHQGWSANVFSVATDLFPARVAGSVTGLGTTTGGIGGMFLALLAGMTIQWFGNQQAIFVWAGFMHPLSWILLRLMLGAEFKPVSLEQPLDMARPSRPLQVAGLAALALGVAVAAAIAMNWGACVAAARSASAAAAAVTAASGMGVIGLLLLYAGGSHRKLA
jgi:ACS family hexuronate transporter-like MFS transporter